MQFSPNDRHLWEITAVRELGLLLLFLLSLWLVYFLGNIFLSVFLALVLAHAFNPAITYMEESWHWPRPLTISFLLTAIVIALFAFVMWLGPLLVEQFGELVRRLPAYLTALSARYDLDLEQIIDEAKNWVKTADKQPQQILGNLFGTTGRALGLLSSVLGVFVSISVSLLVIIVTFFFFAWHFNDALEKLQSYLPASKRDRICEIALKMDKAVGYFFRGRLTIAIIVGVMLAAGWFLSGVPYWFFLGMLTGLMNIFPYLAVIGWPLAILLKYADTLGGPEAPELLSVVVWPSIVYIVVQFLDGWVLTPWIQSSEMNLNAATIVIVVLMGGALAGMWGLLFAVPVAACAKILIEELAAPGFRRWAATH